MALATSQDMVDDTDIYFGESTNVIVLGNEGNLVVSGVAVTANASSDLTNAGQFDVDIASGIVFVNNLVTAVSSGNFDLSVEFLALGATQSRFVYIYISDTGTITKVAGAIATTGQELPPLFASLPDNLVILARILLTNGDTVLNDSEIKELRMFTADGSAYANSKKSYWGDLGNLQIDFNGTNSRIFNTTSGRLQIGTVNSDIIQLVTDDTIRWVVAADGHFIPNLDSTYDIASSSTQVRVGYFDEIQSTQTRLRLQTVTDIPIEFRQNGTGRWQIGVGGGNFTPITDNVNDIGSLAASVRTGYFETSVIIPGAGAGFIELQGPSANFRVSVDGANDFVIRDVDAALDVFEIENGGGSVVFIRRELTLTKSGSSIEWSGANNVNLTFDATNGDLYWSMNGVNQGTTRQFIRFFNDGNGDPAIGFGSNDVSTISTILIGTTNGLFINNNVEISGDLTNTGNVGIKIAPNGSLGDLLIGDALPVLAFKDTDTSGSTARGQIDWFDSTDTKQGSMGIDDQGTLYFDALASSTSIRWLIANTELLRLNSNASLNFINQSTGDDPSFRSNTSTQTLDLTGELRYLSSGSNSGTFYQDGVEAKFGSSRNARIQYNGTDLIINPRVSGTGNVRVINGTLQIGTTNTFTSGQVMIESTQPSFYFFETGQAADIGGWNLNVNSGSMAIATVTDNGTFIDTVWSINRAGHMTMTDDDSGTVMGPTLTLYRDNSSPSDGDDIGAILFDGESSNGTRRTYARIFTEIDETSNTAEDGTLFFQVMDQGSLVSGMIIDTVTSGSGIFIDFPNIVESPIGALPHAFFSGDRLLKDDSTIRAKKNVRPLEFDTSLIWGLNLKTYNRKNEDGFIKGEALMGFIAEEVYEVAPYLVPLDKDEVPQSVALQYITMSMFQEMKYLRDRVKVLEAAA